MWPANSRPRITPTRVGLGVSGEGAGDGRPPRVWGRGWLPRGWRVPSMDHPHACGAGVNAGLRGLSPRGSPPRVWGWADPSAVARARMRITPTRVGLGPRPCTWSSRWADHPHACGAGTGAGYWFLTGSPPRVWGLALASNLLDDVARITPTHVGLGCGSAAAAGSSADHPHACGAGRQPGEVKIEGRGSPPRMWGWAGIRSRCRVSIRITPTHVGLGEVSPE